MKNGSTSSKIILGLDPGMATTGWGVVQNGKILGCGLIETDKKLPHGKRLDIIYKGIAKIINGFNPDEVAVERLFFATNALTAIAVGQAIGVIKLAVHHGGKPIFDYAPMQVKLMIGGSGKADKKVIKDKIKRLFKIREKKGMRTHFDNTADALAIALCHILKTS
jgi:crossover junction endodeoxyribonuclease RuvC